MSSFKHDQPIPFDWPEPLVIDVIRDCYQDVVDPAARTAIARLQAAVLRELCTGRSRQAAGFRLELIAACAARGIPAQRIAQTDLAVIWELTQVISARFRASPRLRADVCDRLEAALRHLRSQPSVPVPTRQRVTAPPHRVRQPVAATG